MEGLRISVVIPTYNRSNYLRKAVDSLLNQSRLPDEIIVINDGSCDDTIRYLEKICKNSNIIKFYSQKNGGPSKARNLGIKVSNGDIICFFDDDEIAHRDWIKEIVRSFEYGDIAGVGGLCIELDGENVYERYVKSRFTGSYSKKLPYLGGNIAFYRDVLIEVGGFDERLKTGEDVDLSFRIYLKNYKVIFNKKMIVYHFNTCKNILDLIKKGYYRGFYYPYLNKKYPLYFTPTFRITVNSIKIVSCFVKLPVNIIKFLNNKEIYYLLEPFLNCIYRLSVIFGILSGYLSDRADIKCVYNRKIASIKEEILLMRITQKLKSYMRKWVYG